MRLWALIDVPQWQVLQTEKYLQRPASDSTPALQTLAQELHQQRPYSNPSQATLPLLLWYQWQDPQHRRPDLRFGGHLPHGQVAVRASLEVSAQRVFLLDALIWQEVSEQEPAFLPRKLFEPNLQGPVRAALWQLNYHNIVDAEQFRAR